MSGFVVKKDWLLPPAVLTEKTTFPDPEDVPKTLKFDLKKLKSINSYGIRNLIQFIRQHPDRPLEYHNCPVLFVETLNIVRELMGRDRNPQTVKSLSLPYHCEGCNRFDERLVLSSSIILEDEATHGQPPFECKKCGEPMILDVKENDYLSFMAG